MFYFKGNGFSFELNKKTYIMGILNVTPDSFFDGGKYNSTEKAVERAIQIEKEGADIIDIGAQSTRPGSITLTDDEELNVIRSYLIPVAKSVNIPVSVDTFYPKVAEYCLENGAKIINDVSGTLNPEMAKLIKQYNAGWVVMHNPSNASDIYDYSAFGGVVNAVNAFFEKAENTAKKFGIPTENLCFDMGIGFGKSHKDNIELIKNSDRLKKQEKALLTALSCKRVTNIPTNAEGYDRVFPTVAADVIAICGKTDFIRVHHVKEAVLSAKMADEIVR